MKVHFRGCACLPVTLLAILYQHENSMNFRYMYTICLDYEFSSYNFLQLDYDSKNRSTENRREEGELRSLSELVDILHRRKCMPFTHTRTQKYIFRVCILYPRKKMLKEFFSSRESHYHDIQHTFVIPSSAGILGMC